MLQQYHFPLELMKYLYCIVNAPPSLLPLCLQPLSARVVRGVRVVLTAKSS